MVLFKFLIIIKNLFIHKFQILCYYYIDFISKQQGTNMFVKVREDFDMNKYFLGLDIIQDIIKLKWIPEILESIENGHHRYNRILESIEYLSHTELQRKLNVLLNKKVIIKCEIDGHINYYLNEFGIDIIHILHHFAELNDKYSTLYH